MRSESSEKFFTENILRNRMLNEMFYEIVPILKHDDNNSMMYSVENRSPYLDRFTFIVNQIPVIFNSEWISKVCFKRFL